MLLPGVAASYHNAHQWPLILPGIPGWYCQLSVRALPYRIPGKIQSRIILQRIAAQAERFHFYQSGNDFKKPIWNLSMTGGECQNPKLLAELQITEETKFCRMSHVAYLGFVYLGVNAFLPHDNSWWTMTTLVQEKNPDISTASTSLMLLTPIYTINLPENPTNKAPFVFLNPLSYVSKPILTCSVSRKLTITFRLECAFLHPSLFVSDTQNPELSRKQLNKPHKLYESDKIIICSLEESGRVSTAEK